MCRNGWKRLSDNRSKEPSPKGAGKEKNICGYIREDTGSIQKKSEQGRPRATREDRHLSIIVIRNRGATASQLSPYLYAATGNRVSRLTVSKNLRVRELPENLLFESRSRLRPEEPV
ncbi:hypothetical protein TNCV_4736011 [Trichonephila clavipes]|nr:hypothetical protein TNCV_4736011 [Trichonephila clavipes]